MRVHKKINVCYVSNKFISTENAFDFSFAKLPFKMKKKKKASILILFSLLVLSAAYKGKIYILINNNLLALMRPSKNGKLEK